MCGGEREGGRSRARSGECDGARESEVWMRSPQDISYSGAVLKYSLWPSDTCKFQKVCCGLRDVRVSVGVGVWGCMCRRDCFFFLCLENMICDLSRNLSTEGQ